MEDKEFDEFIKKMQNSVFRYYNCNPKQKRTDDCVIRAISEATGESWEKTLRDLTEYMVETGDMLNTPELYGKYLSDKGWVEQQQPMCANHKKMKIKDFVKQFNGRAVIHVGDTHVSYVSDGKLWDIWNCENEVMGVYWIPKHEMKK